MREKKRKDMKKRYNAKFRSHGNSKDSDLHGKFNLLFTFKIKITFTKNELFYNVDAFI